MADYGERTILQITGGTAAKRATLTLGLRELWADVDGGGAPTGDLYIGDGATPGGVPLTDVGVTDHGALTGLGDNDHPQYRLVADAIAHSSLTGLGSDDHTQYAPVAGGIRNFTGNHLFGGNLTAVGLFVAAAGIQVVNTGPTELLFNTASSNADGARANIWQAGGQKADTTQHYLGFMRVAHDGAANDQKGRWLLLLNRSETGLGTPDEKVRVDDHMKVTGEVRSHSSRVSQRYNAAATAMGTGWTDIPWGTDVRTDTGFTWNGGATEVTVNFTGAIEIGYDVTAQNTTINSLSESQYKIQVNAGGAGFADLAGTFAGLYHRNVTANTIIGQSSCSCRDRLVAVTSGDIFKVQGQRIASSGTVALTVGGCRVSLRRIAQAF